MIQQYPQLEFAYAIAEVARTYAFSGAKVIDMPCGHGETTVILAKNLEMAVTGYDISEECIRIARERSQGKAEFHVGDIHDVLKRLSGIQLFCLINSYFLLDHREQILSSVFNALNKGGFIALIIPNINSPNYRNFKHLNSSPNKTELTAGQVTAQMTGAGFSIERTGGLCRANLYGRRELKYMSRLAPLYLRLLNKIMGTLKLGQPSYFLIVGRKA